MAGFECHIIEVSNVPCGNNVASRVWVCFEKVEGVGDLVDDSTVVAFPVSPLC